MIRALTIFVVTTAVVVCASPSWAQSDLPFQQRAGDRARAQRALQGLGRSSFGPDGDKKQDEANPAAKEQSPFQSRGKQKTQIENKLRFVEIEITGNLQGQIGVTQEWIELLNQVGADRVRARSGKYDPSADVEEVESKTSTTIIVHGALTRGRKLIMSGGSYTLKDRAAITEFIRKLKDDGADTTLADKLAFGLTAEQLVDVHTKLSSPVDVSTKGASTGAVVGRLIRDVDMDVVVSPQARRMLGSRETVAEELSGMSTGTTLAAAIRPLGLVLQPKRKQGEPVKLHLIDTRESDENWPVGWPIEQPLSDVAPAMFEKTKLQINDFPLQKALDAVERRLKIPFLYDHNSIARADIDTMTTKVTLNNDKIGYMVAIRKLLGQSRPRMFPELRIDESGKPFLWISTQ